MPSLLEWPLIRKIMRASIFRNGWLAVLNQTVSVAGSLGETVILARLLGLREFGDLLVLTTIVSLVFGVFESKSGDAVIKFVPQFCKYGGEKSWPLLRYIVGCDSLLALGAFALLYPIALFAERFLSVPHGSYYLLGVLGAAAGLRSVSSFVGSYLRVSDGFGHAVKIGCASTIIRVLLIASFVYQARTGRAAAYAIALSDLAFSALCAWAFFDRVNVARLFGMQKLDVPDRKRVLRFMIGTNIGLTIRMMGKRLDTLFISALLNSEMVAIYRVAARLATSVLLLSDPLVTALYPELSQLYARKQFGKINRLLKWVFISAALAGFGFLAAYLLFGETFLAAIAGQKYSIAFRPSFIMLCGVVFSCVFFWARPVLLAQGKTGALVIAAFFGTLCSLAGLFILTPRFGIDGAAASLACYHITVVLGLLLVLRRSEMMPLLKGCAF